MHLPGGTRIHVTEGADSPAREAWYRAVQLHHLPPHSARFAGPRWSSVEAGLLEQRARQLDEQRRDFMRGVLQLLLWQQQQQQGHPAALLPEEVFFQILLGACPDSTLRAQLEARFAVVAEHLQLADAYAQRSTALAAHAAEASEPDEAQLQQLSEDYVCGGATAGRRRARARTVRPCAPLRRSSWRRVACSTVARRRRRRRRRRRALTNTAPACAAAGLGTTLAGPTRCDLFHMVNLSKRASTIFSTWVYFVTSCISWRCIL